MKHFNTLEFVRKSKEFGCSEQLAIFQAQQIEDAIDIAVTAANNGFRLKDLATKSDIKKLEVDMKQLGVNLTTKIEQYRYDSLNIPYTPVLQL